MSEGRSEDPRKAVREARGGKEEITALKALERTPTMYGETPTQDVVGVARHGKGNAQSKTSADTSKLATAYGEAPATGLN